MRLSLKPSIIFLYSERTGLGDRPLVGEPLEDEPELANNVANEC